MFLSEDEKDSTKRFKRLSNDFADPLTEVHVAFFTAALPIFTNYNKFLQRNDPLPHKILPMTKSLALKIAGRFILRDKFQSDITINLIENAIEFYKVIIIQLSLKYVLEKMNVEAILETCSVD